MTTNEESKHDPCKSEELSEELGEEETVGRRAAVTASVGGFSVSSGSNTAGLHPAAVPCPSPRTPRPPSLVPACLQSLNPCLCMVLIRPCDATYIMISCE